MTKSPAGLNYHKTVAILIFLVKQSSDYIGQFRQSSLKINVYLKKKTKKTHFISLPPFFCGVPQCVSSGLWDSHKIFYGHIAAIPKKQCLFKLQCSAIGPKYELVSFSETLLLSLLTLTCFCNIVNECYSETLMFSLCAAAVVLIWSAKHRTT